MGPAKQPDVNAYNISAQLIEADGAVGRDCGDIEKRPSTRAPPHRVNDLLCRGYRTQQLMRGGKGDEPGRAIDKLRELESRQFAGAKIWLCPANIGAHLRKSRIQRRRIQLGQHHRGIAA